jgi:hypothetical protein
MGNDFLGRGWAFPPDFYAGGAEVSLVSGEEDIRQSLQVLLSTSLNERIMSSDFGCELSRFLFEEIDQSLVNDLRSAVTDSILKNEGRIEVDEVGIQDTGTDSGLITISIDYTVRTTNNRYNLVYPFYINEASI